MYTYIHKGIIHICIDIHILIYMKWEKHRYCGRNHSPSWELLDTTGNYETP